MKLPKALTYTFAVFFSIFTWQGYELLINGYIDPFAVIASFGAIPFVLIVAMVTEAYLSVRNKEKFSGKKTFSSAVIAFFLTLGPIFGYLIYTASDSYQSFLDVPQWNEKEKRIVGLAVDELAKHPSRHTHTGLAKKSVAYLEDIGVYRVMFIYQGKEVAEIHVDSVVERVVSIRE